MELYELVNMTKVEEITGLIESCQSPFQVFPVLPLEWICETVFSPLYRDKLFRLNLPSLSSVSFCLTLFVVAYFLYFNVQVVVGLLLPQHQHPGEEVSQ